MTLALLVEVLFGFLLSLFFQAWCATIQPVSSGSLNYKVNVSCFIIDLQYVDCNWSKPLMQEINYTFSTAFGKNPYHECPKYLQEDGRHVGCRIPLKSNLSQFEPFNTTLSVNNDYLISTYYPNLLKQVILSPPSNITLNKTHDDQICLDWKSNVKPKCVVSMVRYRQDSGEWKERKTHNMDICISLVNNKFLYTLQVRIKIGALCGESNYWSNWSVPLQWGNNTEPPFKKWWNIAVVVLGVLLLITLSALLCYFESRKRLPLLPAVLVPGKNLQDLFEKYNGNVETWVYMSKELKEAFEPDFTESPCVVTEPSPSTN